MAHRRQSIAAAALAKGAVAALILGQAAQGADTKAHFDVSVTLRPAGVLDPTLCQAVVGKVHPLGVTAIVKCSPVPTPGGPDRVVSSVLFYMSRGVWLGTADETMGLGTVTSWRVVRLANRDYLEMMVGW